MPKKVPFAGLSKKQRAALIDLRRLRKEMEADVERMIDFLDATDGYTMSEAELGIDDQPQGPEDDLEPSLCGVSAADIQRFGRADDCEEEQDDEPSLAAPENHPNHYMDGGGSRSQEHWACGKHG